MKQAVSPTILRAANEQSRKLRALVRAGREGQTLVMPGAYDGFSARLFESLGFPAIQCSSGPIGWTHGQSDGEQITSAQFVEATRCIVQSVAVPVNADAERGYADAAHIDETVRALVAIGAAGMNVEDGAPHPRGTQPSLVPLDQHLEKLQAIMAAKATLHSEFFLNARVDALTVLREDLKGGLREAVKRGQAYAQAGADCVFFTNAHTREVISTLVKEVPAPVSVLAGLQTPPVPELRALGVARVSYGYAFAVVAAGAMKRLALEVRQHGTLSALRDAGFATPEAVALMERPVTSG